MKSLVKIVIVCLSFLAIQTQVVFAQTENNLVANQNTFPYQSCIETPAVDGEEVLSGKVKISGWYVYGKPINTIQIYVDNKYIGTANRHARTDLAQGGPAYDYSQAGFSYVLDTDKFGSKGMHLVEIRATASDGTVDKKEININLGKVELGFDNKIEKPNTQAIKGITQVSGWFVYKEPIVKMEILVDDKYVGTASRLARPDLKKTHSGYDLSKAGYSYMLDTTKLTNGTHQIGVMAYLENGERELDWKNVTVNNSSSSANTLPYQYCIETPAVDGEKVLNGKVKISGWYVYGKPINTIQIYVDKKYIGTASRHARTDLEQGRSGYDSSKAGFSYVLDTDKLGSKGMHLVEVRAAASDGTVDKKEFSINLGKVELDFDNKIEYPNTEVVQGKIQVSGWFGYKVPMTKIEILVDEKYIGTASRFARPDLKEKYRYYDVSKAGFSYQLDTTKLSNGRHQIGVLGYFPNGKKELAWKYVTVNNSTAISATTSTTSTTSSSKPSFSVNNLSYQSYIASPAIEEKDVLRAKGVLSGKVNISGWYVYRTPIKTIQIYVDNQYIGTANRHARTDLAQGGPAYDYSQAGFSYVLDTDKLGSKGMHLVEIRATASDGTVDKKEFNINLGKADGDVDSAGNTFLFQSRIDTPATDGEKVLSGKVNISGWFTYAKPINTIQIYVDNQYKGTASRHARTDLPQGDSDIDFSQAGFSYVLDTDKFGSKGMHLVEIRAIASDGAVEKREFNINLGKAAMDSERLIEYPNQEVVQGKIQVSGWFGYKEPMTKIEILVDDKYIATASRFARPDLKETYPEFDLSKAGFSYKLDTTKLSNGTHQIGVLGYFPNGKKELAWKEIIVKN